MNVAVPAASLTVTSPIDTVGASSSSVIVPTAWPSSIVTFTPPLRFTRNVSFASSSASWVTGTTNVAVVAPGAIVSVCVVAV